MISADEARRRQLGPFRGFLIAAPLCGLAWAPFIALLVSRMT